MALMPPAAHTPRARAVVVAVVVVVASAGCATVEGLAADGRLGDACRLHQDEGGWVRDREVEGEVLTQAVANRVSATVEGMSDDDVNAIVGEPLPPGQRIGLAWLTLQAGPGIQLHEVDARGIATDDEVDRILAAALPPLLDPPPPLMPPGPLVLPGAPDPRPPPPPSGGRRSRGLMDAFVDLVTLPFTIVGAIGQALISIPLDLFGAGASFRPGGTRTTAAPKDRRLPGEAILPPEAWEAAKQRLLDDHAAAVTAVTAARADRAQRVQRLKDATRQRCVVDGARRCRRLAMQTANSVMVVTRVGLGSVEAPCGLDADLWTTAEPQNPVVAVVPARPDPWAPLPLAPPPPKPPVDVRALDADDVSRRLASAATSADHLDAIACRIDIKPTWRRLLKKPEALRVRLAGGPMAGVGVTVMTTPAATMRVGGAVPLAVGDHLKVVVGSDSSWLGGAVGRFDGTLPMVLAGESLTVTCR